MLNRERFKFIAGLIAAVLIVTLSCYGFYASMNTRQSYLIENPEGPPDPFGPIPRL